MITKTVQRIASHGKNVGKQKENVFIWLNQNTMLLMHILYAYGGRKYRNKM